MTEELRDKIKALADKATASDKPHDAMQYAQAALNIAHTYATLRNAEQLK